LRQEIISDLPPGDQGLRRLLARDPALRERLDNLKNPEDRPKLEREALARSLTQQFEKLNNLGLMRRALALKEWPSEKEKDTDTDPLNRMLREARVQLARRFRDLARQTLRSGDEVRQLAALTMLAELGTSVVTSTDIRGVPRGLDKEAAEQVEKAAGQIFGSTVGLRGLDGEVADLVMHAKSPLIREAAARTLGLIYANAATAAAALSELLRTGTVRERRAAAGALASMTRMQSEVAAKGSKSPLPDLPDELVRSDTVALGRALLPVLAQGLEDADVGVRRGSAEAWDSLSLAVYRLVPQPQATERAFEAAQDRQFLLLVRRELEPLLQVIRQQVADGKGLTVVKAINDPDLRVRILSRHALENVGNTRRRLRRLDTPAPAPAPGPERTTGVGNVPMGASQTNSVRAVALLQQPAGPADPVLEVLRKAVPPLAEGTRDPEPLARLAAVEALEAAGHVAVPAAPALIRAVRDPYRFVRWAAARTLGELGPLPETENAVPALAWLLHDEDLDLALSAATALSQFGPAASSAVPDLIWALGTTDGELRKGALDALISIGTEAKAAIPAIARAMSEPDSRVRREAAIGLGKFGSLARSAVPALERALQDESPEVRQAASDALFSVLGSGPK
jgi:HEAT repeat protein